MRRRIALAVALVAAIGAAGAGLAFAVARDEPTAPVVVSAGPFSLRGQGDAAALVPVRHFVGAEALLTSIEVFSQPAPPPGTAPERVLSNPTHEGFPLVFHALEARDGWVHVRLPIRPNGSTGWVRMDEIHMWEVPNRVLVQLSANRLWVLNGNSDEVLFTTDVAVGRGNTPTPLGDFYIDIVNPLQGNGVYGWGQLSVAGFSNVHERFAGGIGQIALHGTNRPDLIGQDVSNGCIRMRNDDIAMLSTLAPLGTPVHIVP